MLHPEAKAARIVLDSAARSVIPATGWRPNYGYLVTCRRPGMGKPTYLRADTYEEAVAIRERERRSPNYPHGSDFWLRMRTAEDEERRLLRRAERRAANDGGDAYVVVSSDG